MFATEWHAGRNRRLGPGRAVPIRGSAAGVGEAAGAIRRWRPPAGPAVKNIDKQVTRTEVQPGQNGGSRGVRGG